MKLTAGEIYFVGERDFKTKEVTPYVKIGIVREGAKGPRTSAERLDEHQTGNPRELFLIDVISTPAVEEIETRLHKLFAREGVSGEWFQFDDELLEVARYRAKKLRDEAQENLFALEQADIFKKTLSNGEQIEATDQAKQWLFTYSYANELIKRSTKLKKEFESLMIESAEDLEEIDHILTKQTRTGSTFLNLERLEAVHPDVYDRFLITKQSLSQRFTVKAIKYADLNIDMVEPGNFGLLDVFEEMLENIPTNKQAQDELHEYYLLVLAAESEALWNKQIAEAQLKTICGENEAIADVCSWGRKLNEKVEFDVAAFQLEVPDLDTEFLEKRPDVEATIVDPKRGY